MNYYISIIIPVYNVETYLKKCIDSVLNQNLENIEIILVDDGSTDNSSKICDDYKKNDDSIIVIHKKNGGLSNARNVGINRASGKYILFIDGDDYIENDSLIKLTDACKLQKEPDIIFLKSYKIFPGGYKEPMDESLDVNRIVGKTRVETLKYIATLHKYPGSACTKMIQKELVVSNDLFFEFGKKSEDIDWTKNLLFTAKTFGVCDEDYYYYRQSRPGSISNSISYTNFENLSDVIDRWMIDATCMTDEVKKVLFNFAAYEYKVLFYVYTKLYCTEKKEAKRWLLKNKWILQYKKDNQITILRYSIILFGIDFTAKLLDFYMSIISKTR